MFSLINLNLINITFSFEEKILLKLWEKLKKITLWIIEFPQRRKLKNTIFLLEETKNLMIRFSPFETNKKSFGLTSYQSIQHESIRNNICKLGEIFDNLRVERPDNLPIRLDKIILHEWGYFIHRAIPLAKTGKLTEIRELKHEIRLDMLEDVFPGFREKLAEKS